MEQNLRIKLSLCVIGAFHLSLTRAREPRDEGQVLFVVSAQNRSSKDKKKKGHTTNVKVINYIPRRAGGSEDISAFKEGICHGSGNTNGDL